MNTMQRITKNISVIFIAQILNYFLAFFAMMYSARYLGVENFGILSFASSLTSIFGICMGLGLGTLVIREVARNKDLIGEYVSNTILIRGIMSVVTLGLISLLILIAGYNEPTRTVIYLLALFTVFSTIYQIFYSVFQANQQMEYQSVGTILYSIILLGGVLLVIYLNGSVIGISAVYAVGGAAVLIYSFLIFSWKFPTPKFQFNPSKWKSLIQEAWPFAVSGISYNLYTSIDSVILSFIKGQEAVGLYTASYRLILVLIFIPTIFNTAIFPLMSKYYVHSKDTLLFTFEKLFKIMFMLGLPIGVGTVIIASKVILLLYGSAFLSSTLALQILIWSTVLMFARSPFERLLESSNRQIVITKALIIGVVFNVILNLMIIPFYGYVGASVVTVLTDVIVFTLLLRSIKGIGISFSRDTKLSLLKIIIASAVMGIVLHYLSDMDLFLLIGMGAMIYLVLLLVMRIFDENEIKMIKSIFGK